ncbi:tetratricopeptide repeat protein, partial [candidate division WOR-3 bacterium]|nr:tetratricopeptide repeat protein [candidate division WOR-3 bacterium]
YAASYMGLANEYRKQDRPLEAEQVLRQASRLELDRERRMTVLYHLSSFELQNGRFEPALATLDTIRSYGYDQPEFTLRRGMAYEGLGDLKQAEAAYLEAVTADPSRGDLVQALVRLYLDRLGDTAGAKAQLEQWLRRVPSDSQAARQLRQLS